MTGSLRLVPTCPVESTIYVSYAVSEALSTYVPVHHALTLHLIEVAWISLCGGCTIYDSLLTELYNCMACLLQDIFLELEEKVWKWFYFFCLMHL